MITESRVVICRSNPVAPEPRGEKTARALSAEAYDVQILCWDRTGEFLAKGVVNGIPCHRFSIRAQFGTGIGNFPALLRWQGALLWWLISHRHEYDQIHACDFDTVLPALLAKALFGKNVVYDIYDFYADHLRATPRWIRRIIRAVDLRVMVLVDGLIVSDESRWKQMSVIPPQNSTVIYNTPQDVAHLIEINKHPDSSIKLRLVYVGLLQVERGLLDILTILTAQPEWHLDLAGFGGDQEQIVAKTSTMANVTWHGRIPYQQTLELTQSADVVLALYDPAFAHHRYASPNKLFEALMLSKALIVAENTRIDRIVAKEHCGLVVKYGDLTALSEALSTLHEDESQRLAMGANGRRAYELQYNWPQMHNRLLHLYAQLE